MLFKDSLLLFFCYEKTSFHNVVLSGKRLKFIMYAMFIGFEKPFKKLIIKKFQLLKKM
jgi:hypothetical protein